MDNNVFLLLYNDRQILITYLFAIEVTQKHYCATHLVSCIHNGHVTYTDTPKMKLWSYMIEFRE